MVEKVKYSIIKKMPNFEIRKYPELILATAEGEDDISFGLLFNYISGNNKVQEKIKMTAPVITSQKIEMTAPVINKENFMAFIMPSTYDKNTIPLPLDNNVKLKFESEKKLAVIRFGGYTTKNKIRKYKEKLFSELKKNNIKIKGEPILMRYNSPFAPPFLRRNEVGIEIDYE